MKRHPFSMVEILLALGVIAIGICSVMVLFPVGANATRDAAMETYAANAADQILHMVKFKLTMTDGNNQWNNYICDASAPFNGKGIFSAAVPDSETVSMDDIDDTDKWEDYNDLIGGNTLKSGIFPYKDTPAHPYFYQIIVHRGSADDGFAEVINNKVTDFRALATLWADRVQVQGAYLPLNFATRLNLKIEWPVELPSSARQSAYYTLEVFNNK